MFPIYIKKIYTFIQVLSKNVLLYIYNISKVLCEKVTIEKLYFSSNYFKNNFFMYL